MRKPKNTAELFHHWANMVMPEAKCGNVSYDGPVIYSYAEPIGLLLPGNRVLISSRRFSNTTGSHQSQAGMATHHMRRCSAPHITRCYHSETDLQRMHRDNHNYWMRNAEDAFTELKNHPRRKKSVSDKLSSILQSYNAYREFFELDWSELSSDEMRALVEERGTERAAEEARVAERRAEQLRLDQIEQAADLELWREHILTRRFTTFHKTALRLSQDGTEIETTRGARVAGWSLHRVPV